MSESYKHRAWDRGSEVKPPPKSKKRARVGDRRWDEEDIYGRSKKRPKARQMDENGRPVGRYQHRRSFGVGPAGSKPKTRRGKKLDIPNEFEEWGPGEYRAKYPRNKKNVEWEKKHVYGKKDHDHHARFHNIDKEIKKGELNKIKRPPGVRKRGWKNKMDKKRAHWKKTTESKITKSHKKAAKKALNKTSSAAKKTIFSRKFW